MSSFSDFQLLFAGGIFAATGVSLIVDSSYTLQLLKPLTELIEAETGLSSVSARGSASVLPILALAGSLLFLHGFSLIMAAYTLDEKAKRNSVSSRIIYGFTCYYICFKTANGSSLVALIGLANAITGLLLGFTVGFGDGNSVDLEEAAKKLKESKSKSS